LWNLDVVEPYCHFFDSVFQLAREITEKEELAEESRKKKVEGEGVFATQ
jgi:hypothetical protein